MTTSSPHTICWQGSTDYSTSCITDLNTITFTSGSSTGYNYGDSITIGNSCHTYPTTYTIPTLTTSQLSSLSGSTISSISIDTSAYTINFPEEWVNCFPDFDRIEKMCKEYPGLKIALEKFKTVYKLVKDHYDTPEDQRPRP
jgi:hypothetical protein